MFHQKYLVLLPLVNSSASRVVPPPKPGSCSSNFGVFVCIMLECGSNTDAKRSCFTFYCLRCLKKLLAAVSSICVAMTAQFHDFGKSILLSTPMFTPPCLVSYDVSSAHLTTHLAQLVKRASYVLRLCSRPGFDSRPGSLCCMSLPLFPFTFSNCTINKAIKKTTDILSKISGGVEKPS